MSKQRGGGENVEIENAPDRHGHCARIKLSRMKSKFSSVSQFPPVRKPPRAPGGLSKAGRGLWRSIQLEYTVDDAGGVAHLIAACRAEDDLQRMREQVEKDGDTL